MTSFRGSKTKLNSFSISSRPFDITEDYFTAAADMVCQGSDLDPVGLTETLHKLLEVPEVIRIIQEGAEKIEEIQDIIEHQEPCEPKELPNFFSRFKSGIMKVVWTILGQIFSKKTFYAIAVVTGVVIVGIFLWWFL
eukprot:gene11351-4519_t